MFWFMLILWLIGFNGFVVSASNLTATNLFLEQCGVSPGSIPDSIKETGGTSLACAVLQVARPTGAVTTSNSSLYTQEREAHWYVSPGPDYETAHFANPYLLLLGHLQLGNLRLAFLHRP